jgi:MFS family permease
MIPGLITGLLLIDISQTFNSTIAQVSQIRSLASILAVIAAIMIGALSVKQHPKHLIIIGLTAMALVGIGSGTSTTLAILFIMYSFQGLGTGFTAPMINVMIGEHLRSEERAKTMGYLVSAASIAYIISSPIIGYLNNNFGWQSAFLYYQIPLVLISLLLSYRCARAIVAYSS